ncbi:hypothetical protein K505DRAFT_357779 [Melanomma pulvis-pyrius CBS 109.77]|uniref:Alpha/beta hydrolase fold-3 domain-containing protein n=1 Tax=Melanomma pulvis-pyrius CBS 109.77 TaxID=1314802 RepID=A0A6A6XNN8_9PLEO|nr:hypothetical protein K505DRAFT_357779 [Melanomma pulvis-pyrius CBS 109.77]
MPPIVSFADYGGMDAIRKSLNEQMEQGIKAGIFKVPDFTGVIKEEVQIPTRDGSTLRAVQYRPESGEQGPLFVYYHGGGWGFGFPEVNEPIFEILTKELGFTVVGVAYRLAPEHTFPTAANDAYDSLKWAAENASKLGSDPSKGIIVSGTSAGGNIAAVAAHEAMDQKLSPPLTGVFLNIPVLVHPDVVPDRYKPHYTSEEEFKEGIILDRKGMEFFYSEYKVDPKSKLINPLLWPGGHKTQPPTYLQVCGMDPLRDDSLIYESLLKEGGVATRLDVYSGIPHAGLDLLPMLSQAKKSLRDMKAGVQWLLSQKP